MKPQRRSKGAALVTGRLALFAFTCAAAFSLAVMLMVASWGKARAPKRAAPTGPAWMRRRSRRRAPRSAVEVVNLASV